MKKYLISMLVSAIVFVIIWQVPTKLSQEKYLDVDLSVEVLKDDLFQIFYITDSVPTFRETHSIRTDVIGKSGMQTVRFQIPLENGIKQIRLDIGTNRNQEYVVIEEIKIGVGDNNISFEKLSEDFSVNQFVATNGNKFHTRVINNQFDPYLVSGSLNSQVQLLQKSSSKFWPIIIALIISNAISLFCFQIIERRQDPV